MVATGQRTNDAWWLNGKKRKKRLETGNSERVQVSVWTTYGRPIIAIDEVHMNIIRIHKASGKEGRT